MPAWTRKAVSVAEPSVCHQLVSRGTLRKRKYLTPPTSPERSSSQSSGSMTQLHRCLLCFFFAVGERHQLATSEGWIG